MATEYLYPINYTATVDQWVFTGVTPYLHDSDADYISANQTDFVDRNFDFADTAITDFASITKIELEVESRSTTLGTYVHCALSKDGVNWTEYMNAPIDDSDTWIWKDPPVDVTAFFASLADINNCTLRCTSHRPATGIIRVRRARLKITYTVPSVGKPLINMPLVNPILVNSPIIRALKTRLLRWLRELQLAGKCLLQTEYHRSSSKLSRE